MAGDVTDVRPVTRADVKALRDRVQDAWRWIKEREDDYR